MHEGDAADLNQLAGNKMRGRFVIAPAMFAVSAIFLLALELVSGVRPDVAELLVAALGSMQGVTRTTLPFLYLFVGVVMWISLRNPTNRALSVFVTGLALFVMISRLAERL